MKNFKPWSINAYDWSNMLPPGYTIKMSDIINDEGSLWFSNEWLDPNNIIRDNRTKCSCGSKMVLKPEEDDWTFHSDYCDIYQNKLDVRIKQKE